MRRLALDFSRIIREWHTPRQLRTVIMRNRREPDPSVCHSHDFYDANQAMIDALGMQGIRGYGPSLNGPINMAWGIARENEFFARRGRTR